MRDCLSCRNMNFRVKYDFFIVQEFIVKNDSEWKIYF